MSGLTQQQLDMRRTGVGGSEVCAVLGLHPYATPLQVWRAKVEGLTQEETLPMRRGRLLEPAVAAWYAEETGAILYEETTLRHPTCPVALATPDRICHTPGNSPWLLEVKTAGWRQAPYWGTPGTDEVPEQYLLQVQWTLAVMGYSRAEVAVLIGGEDFRIYRVEEDTELQGWMLAAVSDWWSRYVETRRPPPLAGDAGAGAYLASRYPNHRKGLVLQATPEVDAWGRQWLAAREAKGAAEALEEDARVRMQALMGEAEVLQGRGWKATWKTGKAGRRFLLAVDGEAEGT